MHDRTGRAYRGGAGGFGITHYVFIFFAALGLIALLGAIL